METKHPRNLVFRETFSVRYKGDIIYSRYDNSQKAIKITVFP